MSSIVVAGDTSGSVTLQAPAVAGSTVLTLPAVSGTVITNTAGVVTQAMLSTNVAGNGPAFSAYQSTGQTLAATTFTKILFQTEEFDTNNNFDSTTNYRFTPTVAGYYQVNGSLSKLSGTTEIFPTIYKNGVEWKRGTDIATSAASSIVSCIVYLNGSTDFIEMYGYMGVSGATWPNPVGTYFQAFLARSA